jgi:Ca2+-binding RTX toxin-like protein
MRTRSLLLASVAAAVCAAPAASHAATISEEGGSYVFRAAPGEKNSMSLQGGKSGSGGGVTFYVGAGGVSITALPASCDDHRDWHYVECPTPSSGAVRLELGDGDDWFATSSDSELPKGLKIAVDGGEGDDRIDGWHQDETFTGGPGNDQLKSWLGDDALDGGDGDDTLTGAGGSDRLTGGAGNDLLAPDGYEEMATDVVDGGAGVDTIEADYSSRFVDLDPPVAITLGRRRRRRPAGRA